MGLLLCRWVHLLDNVSANDENNPSADPHSQPDQTTSPHITQPYGAPEQAASALSPLHPDTTLLDREVTVATYRVP